MSQKIIWCEMRKKNKREELVPDLTPLMDIMFLLLIFFIVTSVFRKNEHLLSLNLPQTHGSGQKNSPKNNNGQKYGYPKQHNFDECNRYHMQTKENWSPDSV